MGCGKTKDAPRTNERSPITETNPEIYTKPPNEAAATLMNQAIPLIDDERLDDAEWMLEEAIKIDPHNAEIFYWLAYLKYKAGDNARAANLLDKADALAADEEMRLKINSLRELLEASQGN
ncbi:tetratricopeptide repeat protein [bacterium]|nr:tetratricopeptide repeat protein [bacterium]